MLYLTGSLFDQWYEHTGWKPYPFQLEMLEKILNGNSGLLNAPTGSGKTYAVWIPLLQYLSTKKRTGQGPRVLWITPLRALAADIARAMQTACDLTHSGWRVGIRTGDSGSTVKKKQLQNWPEALVTTPESLHILMSMPEHSQWLSSVEAVVVDEWHELLSSKRGTQTELVLARIDTVRAKHTFGKLLRWGISATIANMEEALKALLGTNNNGVIVKSDQSKQLKMITLYPDEAEKFPWAGHIGVKMTSKVLDVIKRYQTTLVFTNTRAQCEIWYRSLLEECPELAGLIAMHHGSLDQELRTWVEDALQNGKLQVVVCTSSLDLGVDFRPVDCVIQIGGPKGVARFMQRAGRSGHRPGATSTIYFVPTHSLELIEASALRSAIERGFVEERPPIVMAIDVLVQYAVTLACGEGFDEQLLFEEVKSTYAFHKLTRNAWSWILHFITTGGDALQEYDEYARVQWMEGKFLASNKKIVLRHRLSIGTIVGDPALKVKYLTGPYLGSIEESFLSRLSPGDTFWFSGKCLEFIRIKDMTALVKKATKEKGTVPQWMGGRMPLSSQMAALIREEVQKSKKENLDSEELKFLQPVFEIQNLWSGIPDSHQLLIEVLESREGHHLFFYPFEGRVLHEILSAIIAYRIAQTIPVTFSLAMNDYGFELLSEDKIPIELLLKQGLFSTTNLEEDLIASVNDSEMAKRRFREIAHISGLLFQGFPGKRVNYKHLQASTQLIFEVLKKYDENNLLLTQAFGEVVAAQLEKDRLFLLMQRLEKQEIILRNCEKFTPLCFPILVDRLRGRLSSEKVEDRIEKMRKQIDKWL